MTRSLRVGSQIRPRPPVHGQSNPEERGERKRVPTPGRQGENTNAGGPRKITETGAFAESRLLYTPVNRLIEKAMMLKR